MDLLRDGDKQEDKENENDIIEMIVPMWKARDPDLKLVLPLNEVMDLLRDVVLAMRDQGKKGRWEWDEEMMAVSSTNQIGTENVSRSALRVANELRLQVTGDNVSVFSAIRAVLRKAILLNDADGTALDDMDKLDSAIKTDSAVSAQLGMTAKAKRKQEKLQQKGSDGGDLLNLEEMIAARFIQKRFKDLVERKNQAERAALARWITKEEFEASRERAKQETRKTIAEEKRRAAGEDPDSRSASPATPKSRGRVGAFTSAEPRQPAPSVSSGAPVSDNVGDSRTVEARGVSK